MVGYREDCRGKVVEVRSERLGEGFMVMFEEGDEVLLEVIGEIGCGGGGGGGGLQRQVKRS